MEAQNPESLELFIVGEEKDALLAALKMCRGDWPWAYKGWKCDDRQEITKIIENVEDVQLEYKCSWHPMQDDEGVWIGSLVFSESIIKSILLDALTLYVGALPGEYEGADFWRVEVTRLRHRLVIIYLSGSHCGAAFFIALNKNSNE